MYKFIICCNNFCLNIFSETLQNLNLLIKKNRDLDNCKFFATDSNADSVRDVIAKNIYFTLSSLSIILKGFEYIAPGNVMTIVSYGNTPYNNQIYNTEPKPAYRISELTVENGTAIDMLIFLNEYPVNEFEKLNKILLDPACKYKNFATFIELGSTNLPFVKKLTRINTISSNVSFIGVTNAYPDFGSILLYANSAVQFVNFYKQWSEFIKHDIVFNRFTRIYKNNKLIEKKLNSDFLSVSVEVC